MDLLFKTKNFFPCALICAAVAFTYAANIRANVIISELLAKNDSGIQAEDGNRYDWIELYNDSDSPVDLRGWHLTDKSNELTKWTFPELTIGARDFLLVFASGLDRTNDVEYLHTNFKLSSDGEYVGLILPDGSNVVDEISSKFPALQADESFGIPMKQTKTVLLGHAAPVRAFIPSDGSLGETWKAETFDDSSWIHGTNAVGYERGSDYTPIINTDVGAMYNVVESCYIRSYFPVTNVNDILNVSLNIRYDDGFVAYINGQEIANANKPAPLLWNSGAVFPHGDPAPYEEFLVPGSPKNLIHNGTNTLAIQGLNYRTTSSDFLIEAEVILYQAEIISYNKTVLDEPTPRAVNSGELIIPPPGAVPNIFINEIMARNSRSVFDESLNYERDWFELYNAEPTNVNLSGYFLTDEPGAQRKWTIPDGVTIPAGGFLLFWADNDDAPPNHCNFTLASEGETLMLSTPATQVVDSVAYGQIPPDISKGRYPDGTTNWYFYEVSTPRASNGAPGIPADSVQVSNPVFSAAGGVHTNNFFLSVSAPGAVVHYTIDGSVPNSSSPVFPEKIKIVTQPGRLLFSDNFGRDFDLFNWNYNTTVNHYGRYDEAGRFRGAHREINYSATANSDFFIPEPKDLLRIVAKNGDAAITPYINFTDFMSPSGCVYTVEFDVTKIEGNNVMPGIVFASNASRQYVDSSPGVGFRFSANGTIEIYDGTDGANTNLNTSGKNLFTHFGITPDGNYRVSVEYFIPNFSGGGQIEVSINVDGAEIAHFFTATGTIGNYISLNCTRDDDVNGAEFDNLLIKALPRDELPAPVVFRCRAYKSGCVPSEIFTRTFLENRNITLPVISVSLDPKHLWDDAIGIYIKGTNGIPGRGINSPLNWNQDWRRPMHIEFFETNNLAALDQDAGVEIFANTSRHNPLKSLALYAKDFYGKSKFKHSIFPDRPAEYYRTFILRNASQGSDSYFRDAMKWDFVKNVIDIDIQAYRPAAVYINGAYFGIMNIRDKLNEYYCETYYGADPDKVDLLKTPSAWPRAGDADHYHAMMNFIRSNNMAISDNYEYIKTQMDVEEFINYELFMIWMANIDWPANNIKYWRPKTPDGKWRWMVYDTDISFWGSAVGRTAYPWHHTLKHTMYDITGLPDDEVFHTSAAAAELLNALMENQDFKQQFCQHYTILLSSMFKAERINKIIDRLKNNLAPEMPYHVKRWQGLYNPGSISIWNNAVQKLKDFTTQRVEFCYLHLLEKFGWTTNDLIDFKLATTNANVGSVRINNLPLTANIYDGEIFKNFTFLIQARPAVGYRFLGWRGIFGNNFDEIVSLADAAKITPIFEKIIPPKLHLNIENDTTKFSWKSYTNDFYSIEQTENLQSEFSVKEAGIESTPPENEIVFTNDFARKFYRIKIEPPPEW